MFHRKILYIGLDSSHAVGCCTQNEKALEAFIFQLNYIFQGRESYIKGWLKEVIFFSTSLY